MRVRLILERIDRQGRVLERREQDSKSFLLQFIQLLYLLHLGTTCDIKDITNATRTVSTQQEYALTDMQVGAPPGDVGLIFEVTLSLGVMLDGQIIGIQIGTGVGGVSPSDVALGTRIAHGAAAGQMLYGGTEIYNYSAVNPNASFMARRYFTNVSGGGITVNEVGIYAVGMVPGAAFMAYPFCIARDLTGGILVPNTQLLSATYTVQITV